MNDYLENLYQGWQNNPRGLFKNLLIDESGENGYSTLCPPIPWMGNIDSSSCAIVSFEPRLDPTTFQQQVDACQDFEGWRQFYFENYFDSFEDIVRQPLARYWIYLGHLAKGLTPSINFDWFQALSNNLIEFPFCQYHSRTHPPQPITGDLKNDFIKRLIFYSDNRKCTKVLALGRPISEFIRDEFGGQVISQNILGQGFNRSIEARRVVINNVTFLFFLRNGPFAMGAGESYQNCYNIGNLITNFNCP